MWYTAIHKSLVSTAPGLVSCYQVCNQNPQLSTLRNVGHLIMDPNEHFHLPPPPHTHTHTHTQLSLSLKHAKSFSPLPSTHKMPACFAAASLPGHMRLPSPFGYMGKTKGGLRMRLLYHLPLSIHVNTCSRTKHCTPLRL